MSGTAGEHDLLIASRHLSLVDEASHRVVLRQGQRFGVFSAIGAPGGAMQDRSGAIDTPKMVPVVSRSASLTWWWDASGNRPATGPGG